MQNLDELFGQPVKTESDSPGLPDALGLDAGMIPILVHNMIEGKVCCAQLIHLLDVIREERDNET